MPPESSAKVSEPMEFKVEVADVAADVVVFSCSRICATPWNLNVDVL